MINLKFINKGDAVSIQHFLRNGSEVVTTGVVLRITKYTIFLFHNGYKLNKNKPIIVDSTDIPLKRVTKITKTSVTEISLICLT